MLVVASAGLVRWDSSAMVEGLVLVLALVLVPVLVVGWGHLLHF